MSATQAYNLTGLFDQAIETFETAVKTGVKVQEEATKCCTDMVSEWGTPQQWQEKAQQFMVELIPAAQQNVDQAVASMNDNAKTSMELLKKSMETFQGESFDDMQGKTRELYEAMLEAMRKNAQTMVQTNTRILESFSELAKKGTKVTTE